MTAAKQPQPKFDLMLPLSRHKKRNHPVALVPTEDKELTAFLMAEIEEVYSLSVDPPACFYCHSTYTALRYKGIPPNGTPYFTCGRCGGGFSRRTGTPLAGFRRRDCLAQFISLLSQQMGVAQAADQLDVAKGMLTRWVRLFRAWLLELDPSGRLHAKVKLGLKPSTADLACPHCGIHDQLAFHGYASRENGKRLKRQFRCRNCRRLSAISPIPARLPPQPACDTDPAKLVSCDGRHDRRR